MIYKRKVHYHETDQMGVVHHSNYIKWFEEARIHLMQATGISYKVMEEQGIFSPVVKVSCDYKASVKFDEVVLIDVKIQSYNGIQFTVVYAVSESSGTKVHAMGESKHCFIDEKGRLISLKKKSMDYHTLFLGSIEQCQ